MKKISYIIICSSVALLVGCGSESESSNDPQASQSKPPLKEPIPDGPPSKIGLSSSSDSVGNAKRDKKK